MPDLQLFVATSADRSGTAVTEVLVDQSDLGAYVAGLLARTDVGVVLAFRVAGEADQTLPMFGLRP